IAKGMGDQGIVASICAAQLDHKTNPDGTSAADYGYRPAVKAIIDRLKKALKGQCLPRTLTPDPTGQVPCLILEPRNTMGAPCTRDPNMGRSTVSMAHQPAQEAALKDPLAAAAKWNCFCEINQTTNDPKATCNPETNFMGPAPAGCNLESCQDDPLS